MIKDFWDRRYSNSEYVYGEQPNRFFKEVIDTLPTGKILLPADGEGRNGVYAASKGWDVDSFDISHEAKTKALSLAKSKGVNLTYKVIGMDDIRRNYPLASFDVIALTYLHLPLHQKVACHKMLLHLLKAGGYVIFEAFSKSHIDNQKENSSAGGPSDVDNLYSEEEVRLMFDGLEVIKLTEEETDLSEGIGHNGKSNVIRFVGRKI